MGFSITSTTTASNYKSLQVWQKANDAPGRKPFFVGHRLLLWIALRSLAIASKKKLLLIATSATK
jgi:hypothetical protein